MQAYFRTVQQRLLGWIPRNPELSAVIFVGNICLGASFVFRYFNPSPPQLRVIKYDDLDNPEWLKWLAEQKKQKS